jgi:spermidine/putrescine transport system ATP-binding protein
VKYAVVVESISKRFGEVEAVKDVTLKILDNEFFSLLGPSGCGKTTTLRIIAGLEYPDSGRVMLGGVDVTDLPTHKRNIGMVFQTLALFPHMNVYENIAFGLKMRGVSEGEIKRRVGEMLRIVRLEGLERRRINQLSGGQRQRVALARALIIEPEVLLLDEPLGALDLKIRQHMMVELKRIQKEVGTTFIYVTHDQSEAMVMSDRIAIMKDGVIQQIGSPREIYLRPGNRFVAQFIGEAINFFEGKYKGENVVSTDLGDFVVDGEDISLGSDVVIAIRPERLVIGGDLPGDVDNVIEGKVILSIFRGSFVEYRVELENGMELIVFKPYVIGSEEVIERGRRVKVGWNRFSAVVLRE